MTKLIVTVDDNRSCAIHASKVMREIPWDEVLIVADKDTAIDADVSNSMVIRVDLKNPLEDVTKELQAALGSHSSELEVALNIFSCSGKLHMALLSAIIKMGLGFRLVALTPEGVKEI